MNLIKQEFVALVNPITPGVHQKVIHTKKNLQVCLSMHDLLVDNRR